MTIQTIFWKNNKVFLIDQTKLPLEEIYLEIDDYKILCAAIKKLSVRGAPAIGIAGAFGVVLGVQKLENISVDEFIEVGKNVIKYLAATRPTAVNLFWALERMQKVLTDKTQKTLGQLKEDLLNEALTILNEDKEICRELGRHGAALIDDNFSVLTHCNAGALATADYGTALGVFYSASQQGKKIKVYADETRPLLQGARLTTWELMQAKIDVILICDNTAASLMQQKKIDAVFVGADRIAGNGDAANKIGTYNVAVLAQYHKIPFYVVAPFSTIDLNISSGKDIPIEERSAEEITEGFGKRTAPYNVKVYSPAFDVTPNELITALVTEKGVIYPNFGEKLQRIKK